jgi:hypothetical protein
MVDKGKENNIGGEQKEDLKKEDSGPLEVEFTQSELGETGTGELLDVDVDPEPDPLEIEIDAGPESDLGTGVYGVLDDSLAAGLSGGTPPPGGKKALAVKGKEAGVGEGVLRSALFYNLIAGLLGGAIAFFLFSITLGVKQPQSSSGAALIWTTLSTGLWGLCLGVTLASAEGFVTGNLHQFSKGLRDGAFWGLLGGLAGGWFGQFIFGAMDQHYTLPGIGGYMLRAMTWSMVGWLIGMGLGVVSMSALKMRNSMLGGALGGLVGGVFFHFLEGAELFGIEAAGRLFGLLAIGLLIGLGLTAVEAALKEAWLRIVKGPLAGKEFVIYQERTVLGSSPKADISLFKDDSIEPEHAVISMTPRGYLIEDQSSRTGTFVNDREVRSAPLKSGDRIQIGRVLIDIHLRESLIGSADR